MALMAVVLAMFISCLMGGEISLAESSNEGNDKLTLFSIVTEIPRTSETTLRESFTRESIKPWAGILLSTAVLYEYDQKILDDVQRLGREAGIGNEENTKTIWRAGPYPILRAPSDSGSLMYFLGDGWIHLGTATGFLLTGHLTGYSRPWNTAIQLFHGMTVSTLFSQALKRATGRESPSQRTQDRGAWRPFPSIKAYNEHTAQYDAFPSGHVMTATLTFTVLAENYPEYSHWILPIEVSWLTVLSLQMVNNGVHWASDYPLGIAMGYQIGKISARMGKRNLEEKSLEKQSLLDRTFFYSGMSEGGPTFNALVTY